MKEAGVRRYDSSAANCLMRLTTPIRSTTRSGRTPSTFPLHRRHPASTPTRRQWTLTQRPRLCRPRVLVNHLITHWERKACWTHTCTPITNRCTTNTSTRTSIHIHTNAKLWMWTLTQRLAVPVLPCLTAGWLSALTYIYCDDSDCVDSRWRETAVRLRSDRAIRSKDHGAAGKASENQQSRAAGQQPRVTRRLAARHYR